MNRQVELWKQAYHALAYFKSICREINGVKRRKRKVEIDSNFSDNSKPPRRFYLERVKDETGVSRTGRVLEGVLWQNGEVTVQWRPPHSTFGFYHSLKEFEIIHVDCHPSCNVIRWLEHSEGWHCFDCGASDMMGNFCEVCGSPSTGYHPATEGWKSTERYEVERELEKLNRRRKELIERLTRFPAPRGKENVRYDTRRKNEATY